MRVCGKEKIRYGTIFQKTWYLYSFSSPSPLGPAGMEGKLRGGRKNDLLLHSLEASTLRQDTPSSVGDWTDSAWGGNWLVECYLGQMPINCLMV